MWHPSGVAVVDDVTTVLIGLAGILDAAKEVEKLEKQQNESIDRIAALNKRMGMPSYDKTPDAVKSADAERLEKLQAELEEVKHHIADMQNLL